MWSKRRVACPASAGSDPVVRFGQPAALWDAVRLDTKARAPTRIVKRKDELFAIDAQARHENKDLTARHALRREKPSALLQEIHAGYSKCG